MWFPFFFVALLLPSSEVAGESYLTLSKVFTYFPHHHLAIPPTFCYNPQKLLQDLSSITCSPHSHLPQFTHMSPEQR